MKPIAAEWVAKAEGDFATMERECAGVAVGLKAQTYTGAF